MSVLSILIADDEEAICFLIEQWLKPMGHSVVTAADGAIALKLVESKKFDLVITDILMPNTDGLSLIAGLRKRQPAARVVAMSGGGRYMNSNDYLKIAQGFGADAAIIKPFSREQFMQGIGRAMAAKKDTPPPGRLE